MSREPDLSDAGAVGPLEVTLVINAPIKRDAFQCGYCIPGQLYSAAGMLNEGRLPLADDRIHCAGQYLAVVVADTPEQARYAASLVQVAYSDEGPPLASLEDARQLEEPQSDLLGQALQYRRGDVDQALSAPGLVTVDETYYDRRTARPMTDNLADYAVPVNADAPRIEAYFIDRPDPPINALGCRGVGELSITGAAAVHHATGRRVRDLPITTDKLM
jgi:CO/xanthine dehydrogenase Mo-binding subunit